MKLYGVRGERGYGSLPGLEGAGDGLKSRGERGGQSTRSVGDHQERLTRESAGGGGVRLPQSRRQVPGEEGRQPRDHPDHRIRQANCDLPRHRHRRRISRPPRQERLKGSGSTPGSLRASSCLRRRGFAATPCEQGDSALGPGLRLHPF